MKSFIKRLTNGSGILNFYFNRKHTTHGDRYHVSVVAQDKKAYSFTLKEEKGGWVLENPEMGPAWAVRMQQSLSNAITEQVPQ